MTVLYALKSLKSRSESSFIYLRREINQHQAWCQKGGALLGVECRNSSVTSNLQVSTEESPSDPLQLILNRLNVMQGQITSLKSRTSEVPATNLSIKFEKGEASQEDTTRRDLLKKT